jgi:hypothetical protein
MKPFLRAVEVGNQPQHDRDHEWREERDQSESPASGQAKL